MDEIKLSESQLAMVEDKLQSLLEVCQILNIPMFATVAVSNDDTKTEYNNIVYGGKAHNIQLFEDHIQKHILIANHFNTTKVTLPRENFALNMDNL